MSVLARAKSSPTALAASDVDALRIVARQLLSMSSTDGSLESALADVVMKLSSFS